MLRLVFIKETNRMRFSAIILLLFAMLGCGSVSQPANDGDNKSQVADVRACSSVVSEV